MRKLTSSELNRIDVEKYKEIPKNPIVVVLDNIRSGNNIGSFFRTSDALLVEAIYLCGYTATPPNKEIHKTALDAENSVAWAYFENPLDAINDLHQKGFTVFAVEQVEGSISLSDFEPSKDEKIALVFGNEVMGVQQAVVDCCDGAIEIPQFGIKHSFNVSVSAGIVLWDIVNKMRKLH
ncbi:MAG TPA: RNA methyltransferase [Prolixibacteraceae bacterium]|nr:RNA methyltransferase [Prolixibacteraceae bacterium]HPS11629.1 RNA methyltransferase [Prolixibacteraceae bacterium]